MSKGMCPYAPGLEAKKDDYGKQSCDYDLGILRRKLLLSLKPNIIVVGGRLPLYMNAVSFDNKEGGIENPKKILLQPKGGSKNEQERQDAIGKIIADGITELLRSEHRVIIIYPIPEAGWNVPERFMQILPRNVNKIKTELHHNILSTSYQVFQERTLSAYNVYDLIPDQPNLIRIYPEKLFCNTILQNRCITHNNQELFYFDTNHLSLSGSQLLVNQIIKKDGQRKILLKR